MNPNYWLAASSFFYVAPSYVCYTLGHPYLSTIYAAVVVSSSSYHATKYPILLAIDIPLAHLAHIITLSKILKGGANSMIPYSCWLLYTITIYYYGFMNQTFIWNPNVDQATIWHASMHGFTSLFTCITMMAAYPS
jgi:hypothetical protein